MVTVALLLVTGCSTLGELRFTQDHRLEILEPAERSTVRIPVEMRWKIRDFTPRPPGSSPRDTEGFFAIFVDRYPMAPGDSIADVLPAGACTEGPTCLPPPDLAAGHNIYVTHETHLTLDTLSEPQLGAPDVHFAIVVLLDGAGKRIGDSGWTVSFEVERSAD